MTDKKSVAAVRKTAKKQKEITKVKVGEVVTLASGVRVKFQKVAGWLVRDAYQNVPHPDLTPFMYDDPVVGKPVLNANHPDYAKALADHAIEKENAGADAMIMFGIELLDPVPVKSEWLPKLEWMAQKGRINLDSFDLNHELDLELLYKKYVIGGSDILNTLSSLSGIVTEEGIAAEAESFQGD